MTYHVDVGETPFFIGIDYDMSKIVISIRGTLSMKVCDVQHFQLQSIIFVIAQSGFLATLVALHFTPVSKSVSQ